MTNLKTLGLFSAAALMACAAAPHSIPSAPITGVAVGTAAANDILAADVSKTLATTTAPQEAINPVAVVSHTPNLVAVESASATAGASAGTNHVSAALPPAPAHVPVSPVQPAATGHYQTVYAGFRGRRSYQVWVSGPQQQGVRYYSGGGCANGRCGR